MDGPVQKRARSEVYGFVMWTLSWAALFAYILWAFVPDSVWHPLGIFYYPNRYWSYAVPMYIFLVWVFTIVVYFGYNLINTEPLNSYYTITDEKANDEGETLSLKDPEQIVPIGDVPITVVNELLYNRAREPSFSPNLSASSEFPAPSRSSLATLLDPGQLRSAKRRDHFRQLTS